MRKLCAADLMNSEVLTVSQGMPVTELAEYLTSNEISGAPVVDDDGKLVGVVSLVDVVASASSDEDVVSERGNPEFYLRELSGSYTGDEIRRLHVQAGSMVVAEIMTPSIYAVEEDATVSEVASLMLRAHLHRVLVTRSGELVGIITSSDLLGLLVEEN